jgi:hypothetical protein
VVVKYWVNKQLYLFIIFLFVDLFHKLWRFFIYLVVTYPKTV